MVEFHFRRAVLFLALSGLVLWEASEAFILFYNILRALMMIFVTNVSDYSTANILCEAECTRLICRLVVAFLAL